jgi:hypothetical protein
MTLLFDLVYYAAAYEEGMMGLLLWVAPDYFFNPDNGAVPLRGLFKTSMKSNHLDKASEICLAGAGASLLGLVLARLFHAETRAEKVALEKMKLTADLATLPLLIQNAFFDHSGIFNHQLFMVFVILKSLYLMAQLSSWRGVKKEENEGESHLVMNGPSTAAFVAALYSAPFAVLLYVFPELFAPGATFAYYLQTSLEDNTFDALATWCLRYEGACLLAFIPLLWECGRMPRFALQSGLSTLALYALVFNRGAVDKTGYADTHTYKGQMILHVTLITAIWQLSKAKFKFSLSASRPRKEEDLVTDLSSEVIDVKVGGCVLDRSSWQGGAKSSC